MESPLDEAVCTLYAKVSWTVTAGELLVKEGDESGYGSISVQDKGTYLSENRSSTDEESSLETRWPYTSGHYKNGAIGLYNMGRTCCLNSLLQTLYMNREFTDMLQMLDMPEDAAALEDNVPYQLLTLFEEMQYSRRNSIYPYRLIRCLQNHGLKLYIQHDVAELYMIIWNLITDQISKAQPQLAGRLNSLCTIHVRQYLTCPKCLQQWTSDSSLIALPLPISGPLFKKPSSLEQALVCFFQPNQLTEENMCFCQNCGEKTRGLQCMKLKTMPHTLILHLKRLHYGKSQCVQKISRRISFPLSLDLNQLLDSEYVCCDPGEQAQWQYKLLSVVAHSGTPRFGHYCSYIRSFTDQRWYSFNDSSVSKVSWDDVKCTFGNSSFHWGETAYLLFYVKAESN